MLVIFLVFFFHAYFIRVNYPNKIIKQANKMILKRARRVRVEMEIIINKNQIIFNNQYKKITIIIIRKKGQIMIQIIRNKRQIIANNKSIIIRKKGKIVTNNQCKKRRLLKTKNGQFFTRPFFSTEKQIKTSFCKFNLPQITEIPPTPLQKVNLNKIINKKLCKKENADKEDGSIEDKLNYIKFKTYWLSHHVNQMKQSTEEKQKQVRTKQENNLQVEVRKDISDKILVRESKDNQRQHHQPQHNFGTKEATTPPDLSQFSSIKKSRIYSERQERKQRESLNRNKKDITTDSALETDPIESDEEMELRVIEQNNQYKYNQPSKNKTQYTQNQKDLSLESQRNSGTVRIKREIRKVKVRFFNQINK
eukprot:TRINITY_DN59160_c0_g1_i14.p1 TRINITY_DN59160_c0_g1~~TRINITY_DN59160_c0_g1_i14.p1  ORF type:complete len:365 (-),score=18.73 TRINITY_DN59160_c0_g1_i14:248-1342(-)